MTFQENLTALRKQKGLSQEALAECLQVSRQAVSKWENGESQPDLENFRALCRVLETQPNSLLGAVREEDGTEPACEKPAEEKARRGLSGWVVAAMLLFSFLLGALLSWLIFCGAGKENKVQPPLNISSFELEWVGTLPEPDRAMFRARFTPEDSAEGAVYTLLVTDASGQSRTWEVEAEQGLCSAEFELLLPQYEVVEIYVSRTLPNGGSAALLCMKLWNLNAQGYNSEKLI